jgi:hypothetical protein
MGTIEINKCIASDAVEPRTEDSFLRIKRTDGFHGFQKHGAREVFGHLLTETASVEIPIDGIDVQKVEGIEVLKVPALARGNVTEFRSVHGREDSKK